MKQTRLSAAFYLTLVFLSGSAVGFFGNRLYFSKTVSADARPRNPEEFRKRYLEEMKTRLSLNETQEAAVNKIFEETGTRLRTSMRSIQEEQFQKVQALLDDKQKEEHAKLRSEREERRKRMFRGPGTGRGPGPGF